MRRAAAALIVGLALVPGPAAARECPPYSEDLLLRCAWGYVHLTPGRLLVPIGEVHEDSEDPGSSARLGYTAGVGAGVFRAFGRFGVGLGAGLTRKRQTSSSHVTRLALASGVWL